MERTLIQDIPRHLGQEVRIQGWVRTIRDQKQMQFLLVRDHTGVVQATVARSPEKADLNRLIASLTRESAVTIVGTATANPVVKTGGVEVLVRELRVEGLADRLLPMDPSSGREANPDVRLNWRFLDLRSVENLLIFQVQTAVQHAMREYWVREGFLEIHSPKLMGSPSESGAELFSLEYFGRPGYLAQSPQFYKQMAMAAGFERVFEFGPAFRADPSFTTVHMTEFTSVDMEMSWIDSHEDVMGFEERWLRAVLAGVGRQFGAQIQHAFGAEVRVPEIPFPRIPVREALEIVRRAGHVLPPERKGDLDPTGQRLLSDHVAKAYGHEFVFVTDYPIEVRPFYHMRYPDAQDLTKSFDLIWKGVEITTGSQREHRYDVLVAQAKAKGLSLEPIQYYLDFFKYGCPPHGGFGFGLERMLMVLLNRPNVREVAYIFRGPTRLHP